MGCEGNEEEAGRGKAGQRQSLEAEVGDKSTPRAGSRDRESGRKVPL